MPLCNRAAFFVLSSLFSELSLVKRTIIGCIMKQRRIYGVCLMLVLSVLWWASIGTAAAEGRPFITKWRGEKGQPLKFLIMGEYKLVVKKGEQVVDYRGYLVQHNPKHAYEFIPPEDGIYTVEAGPEGVSHTTPEYVAETWFHPKVGYRERREYRSTYALLEVVQWGDVKWTTMNGALAGGREMRFAEGIDTPDLSGVQDFYGMFRYCRLFNHPINDWKVDNATDMRDMFSGCQSFNQSLDKWNVSRVVNMNNMFNGCLAFNQPLDKWNMSNVKDISWMFGGCVAFNQSLNDWDVSNVRKLSGLFYGCTLFNQPLNKWDVSKVEQMQDVFHGSSSFNQPLDTWDVSQVMYMNRIFNKCSAFNQDLGSWKLVKANALGLENCGMDVENYTKTLQGWEASGVSRKYQNIEIDATGLAYFREEPHNALSSNGWVFKGDKYDENYVGVRIKPRTLSVEEGKTKTLEVEVVTKEGNDTGVTWSSAAPEIVQVDEVTGNVRGVSPGKAVIRATSKFNTSRYGECDVIVSGVQNVVVTPSEVTFRGSIPQTLQAEVVVFGNGINQEVTWSSDNPQIARVDAVSGEVTPVAPGEVTITATSKYDNRKKGKASITVAGVRSLTLPAPLTLSVGERKSFKPTVEAFGGVDNGVTWLWKDNDNPQVVAMDEDAQEVTTVAPGLVKVTATSKADASKTASSQIMVKGVRSVTLSESAVTLEIGGKKRYTPTVVSFGGVDNGVTWASNDAQCAKVNATTGEIEALAPGQVHITATAKFDNKKKATIAVTVVGVKSIALPSILILSRDQVQKLTPTVVAFGGVETGVKWTSSAPAIAQVNETTGEVKGLTPGEATITATSKFDPTKKATCAVTVKGVKKITLTPTSLTLLHLNEEGRITQEVEVVGDVSEEVEWSSDHPEIVSVDYWQGRVVAHAIGVAVITATSKADESKKATCTVTVKGVTGITLSESSKTIKKGSKAFLTASVTGVGDINSKVKWSSSDPNIVAVNEDTGEISNSGEWIADSEHGNYYLRIWNVGEVTVTATSIEDPTKSATCSVTVTGIKKFGFRGAMPAVFPVRKGETAGPFTVVLEVVGECSKAVTWSSSDSDVITVDPSTGKYCAEKAGLAQLSAKNSEGESITFPMVVPGIMSVEARPSDLTLQKGEKKQVEILLNTLDERGETRSFYTPLDNITLSSEDIRIAKLVETQQVLGVSTGRTRICATSKEDPSRVGYCNVEVEGVVSVAISPVTKILNAGEQLTLSATVDVVGSVSREVSWSGDNSAVATVDSKTGKVTAVGVGEVEITARSREDHSKSATVKVQVAGVRSVSLSVATLLLQNQGETRDLKATVNVLGTVDKGVKWSSNNPSVATVDPVTGKVTAVATGRARITATSKVDATKSATCQVSVAGVEMVSVIPETLTLNRHAGTALQAIVSTIGEAQKTVTWASDHPEVVTVDPTSGRVTANGAGEATITATSTSNKTKSGSCKVTVKGVRRVTVEPIALELLVGQSDKTLVATVEVFGDVSDRVTWSSNHPEIAAVRPASGEVTGKGIGSAILTATSVADPTQKATVAVEVGGVQKVTVTAPQPSLKVGEVITLTAQVEVFGNVSQTVTWSTNKAQVATVDPSSGEVTAVATGSVIITATSTVDITKKASCTLEVTAAAPKPEKIPVVAIVVTPNVKTLTVGEKVTLSATVAPAEATEQGYTWRSEDTNIAEVSATGEVTAKGVGSCKIYAKSNETGSTVEGFCQVTVNAASNNPGGGNPGGNNNWQPQTPQAVEDAALATLVIAPNPFTTQLRIGNPAGVTAWYELVNVTGVVLRSGVVEGNEVMVDTEGLPAGVYFVRLSHQNGVQRTEKVFHY